MNRSKFTSENNYQIDKFIEYYDIQTSEFPEIEELQTLLRNPNKTEIETTRQVALKSKYANRMLSAEQLNYFCDCLVNMQTFISTEVIAFVNGKQSEMTSFVNEKQLETTTFVNDKKAQIETTQGQIVININSTKDSALQAIEVKKQSVITYMDDTTAGAIRNDIGVKGELQTINKNNLVDAINELNENDKSKQDKTDSSLNTISKTVVGAINENKESIVKSNSEIEKRQTKVDNLLNTVSKTIVGAINENALNIKTGNEDSLTINKNIYDLTNDKQDKTDISLKTTSKNIVGAINENTDEIKLKQQAKDNNLNTSNKYIVNAINENKASIDILNTKVADIMTSGTNWIRYADGTQIVWFSTRNNYNITTPYGALFFYNGTLVFPKTFSNPPIVTSTCANTGLVWSTLMDATTAGMSFRLLSPLVVENLPITMNIIAVGKWK